MPSTTQKLAELADVPGRGPRLLEQLVDRLVVQRGHVSLVAGEEVGLTIGVEIDAERFGDPRLATLECRYVVVLIAVVKHAKRPVPLARFALAGEQLADFARRVVEAGEQLPPDLVQPLQLCRQIGRRCWLRFDVTRK